MWFDKSDMVRLDSFDNLFGKYLDKSDMKPLDSFDSLLGRWIRTPHNLRNNVHNNSDNLDNFRKMIDNYNCMGRYPQRIDKFDKFHSLGIQPPRPAHKYIDN